MTTRSRVWRHNNDALHTRYWEAYFPWRSYRSSRPFSIEEDKLLWTVGNCSDYAISTLSAPWNTPAEHFAALATEWAASARERAKQLPAELTETPLAFVDLCLELVKEDCTLRDEARG